MSLYLIQTVDFNSLQKDIDDLNKLNEDLEYKHQIPDFKPDEESVLDEMNKSIEELDNNLNQLAYNQLTKRDDIYVQLKNEVSHFFTNNKMKI